MTKLMPKTKPRGSGANPIKVVTTTRLPLKKGTREAMETARQREGEGERGRERERGRKRGE